MAPFLGCTNGSFVGVNQWLPCWGGPKPFSSGWRLAAGAFFLLQIAFLGEKHHFPRLAACRRRFFMVKNHHFGVAGAARREHNSSFPKNSSISPIETSS